MLYKYTISIAKYLIRNFGILSISIILFWICVYSYLKNVMNQGNMHIYDVKNNAAANGLVQYNKSWQGAHPNRRYHHMGEAGNGSKDFQPNHAHVLSPMQKILEVSGQRFQHHVDEPDFKENHDFRRYKAPKYLKDFKNPCFYKNVSLGQHTRSRPLVILRCVPYFMIVGFPKCGTTDLWDTLKKHPDIKWSHPKEINFFNKKHFAFVPIEGAVESYQKMITSSTLKIEKCVSDDNPDFHPCITGDASVDTIFDNSLWRKLPGNEHQPTEPFLTNANYAHQVNPNMKLIILLRNPVERLYSDYLFMSSCVGYKTSPEDFHTAVEESISNYTACLQHRTQRACAYDMYDDWSIPTYKVRLKIGMYHIFISDWLKLFPRTNIMVITSEATRGGARTQTVMKLFKFLDIGFVSREEVETQYGSERKNERDRKSERMLSKTRKLLTNFYKQFNDKLETLFPHVHY